MIEPDYIRQVLHYDPDTGLFTRDGTPAGWTDPDGYTRIEINGRGYRAHRLAWAYVHGRWPTGHVDHVDRNRRNNAISNLRDVDVTANNRNRSTFKNNKAGVTGVRLDPRCNRWQARITINGKTKSLGYFPDMDAAVAARLSAEQDLS